MLESPAPASRRGNCLSTPPDSYPIGTAGLPWGDAEFAAWRARLERKRSYEADLLGRIEALRSRFDVVRYGQLDYEARLYPLYAIRCAAWRDDLPVAVVTGGVHGYETSGVLGAQEFVEQHAQRYEGRINLLVAPCVSPWAYERVQRWNMHAIDPNRSFRSQSLDGSALAFEAAALMRLVAPIRDRTLVHVDLHETTDSDEAEFRPALAARDGKPYVPGHVPDGFYVVGDSENPQPAFQEAVIEAVAGVTHIAEPDAAGRILGSPVVSPGVIHYPVASLGLCAGLTAARYATTTEVYPDSPRVTAAQCNAAQVAAVRAAIEFALAAT